MIGWNNKFTVILKDEHDNCWCHGIFDTVEEAQQIGERIETNDDAMAAAMSLCIGPDGVAIGREPKVIIAKITAERKW